MILNVRHSLNYGDQLMCVLLFLAPLFGFIHKKINNVKLRKWSSTLFCLFSMQLYCEEHLSKLFLIVLHTVTVCIMLKFTPRKYIRFVSLYSMLTLTIYRCYIGDEMKYKLYFVDFILLAITARIMGMSFDIYYSCEAKKNQENKLLGDNGILFSDSIGNPSVMDIFHYLCSYQATAGGVFYRYRTFEDYMQKRFWKKSFDNTIDKKMLLECILNFIFFWFYFPYQMRTFDTSYFTTDEYLNSSAWDMCLAMIQLGIGFNITLILFTYLSEFSCKTSGLGYYPVRCINLSGHGPTKHYKELSELSSEAMEQETFDYLTVKSFYFKGLFSPWILIYARYWNKTQEYWISTASRNKVIPLPCIPRLIIVTLLCFLWHGIHIGILMAFIASGIFNIIQYAYWRIYEEFLKDKGWISSAYIFLNLVIAIIINAFSTCYYILSTWENIFFYMGKVYYAPIIIDIFLYVVGVVCYKYLKITMKRKQQLPDNNREDLQTFSKSQDDNVSLNDNILNLNTERNAQS